ncbi:hypothetical protein M9458_022858, partial [Cirrhinus mrigala]
PRHVSADLLEPHHVSADCLEPCHVSADPLKPRHISAYCLEPNYVSTHLLEPRHVSADHAEPTLPSHMLHTLKTGRHPNIYCAACHGDRHFEHVGYTLRSSGLASSVHEFVPMPPEVSANALEPPKDAASIHKLTATLVHESAPEILSDHESAPMPVAPAAEPPKGTASSYELSACSDCPAMAPCSACSVCPAMTSCSTCSAMAPDSSESNMVDFCCRFHCLPLLHGPGPPVFHCLLLFHGPGPPVLNCLSLLHDPGLLPLFPHPPGRGGDSVSPHPWTDCYRSLCCFFGYFLFGGH